MLRSIRGCENTIKADVNSKVKIQMLKLYRFVSFKMIIGLVERFAELIVLRWSNLLFFVVFLCLVYTCLEVTLTVRVPIPSSLKGGANCIELYRFAVE